ncbi:MAG: aspartate carbamoyltransferase [Candidatus Woesearchaeota archaeon]
MDFANRSLISITDFSKEECLEILKTAEMFEKDPNQELLSGHLIGTLFFEPSTRTRLSFESAVLRLNGKITGFSDSSTSSVRKGESLHDTIKTVEKYCDLIIMRHPLDGSARYASEISKIPIINAGDGSNQHPTQTLLDIYSIQKTQGTLENLNIVLVGDLKYGRTVHSLVQALSKFNCTFCFVSPEELRMPRRILHELDRKGIKYEEKHEIEEVLPSADVFYMTRIQKERFSDPVEYENVKDAYILRKDMITGTKPNLKIMHPLPRVNEIEQPVDELEEAYYFEQAEKGVYIRQALISLILGAK